MESKDLSGSPEFLIQLGGFYHSWAIMEAAMDCALRRFLDITPTDAHLFTAGMEYGRKAQLLRNLIARRDHKNKSELNRTLNIIQNESKRNIFAHSIVLDSV